MHSIPQAEHDSHWGARRSRPLTRLAVWMLERSCEALLLTGLILLLSEAEFLDRLALSYAIDVTLQVMLGTGYLVTTMIVGVVWRSPQFWVYPAIATSLFLAHLQLLPESGWTWLQELVWHVVGAGIVFACTLAGNSLLRNWLQTGFVPPARTSTTNARLTLKRLVVWVMERTAEVLLLALLVTEVLGFSWLEWALWVAGVMFVLGSGYSITMLLAGVVWRSDRIYLYPLIAAGLFLFHLWLLITLLEARLPEKVPLYGWGALIVFACTLAGSIILRYWTTTPSHSSHTVSGSA